jgi:hypothetical protein
MAATASRLRAAQGAAPAADRGLNRSRARLATAAACRRRSMPYGDSRLACQGDKGAVRRGWWAALRRQCHVGASDDTYRVEKASLRAHRWGTDDEAGCQEQSATGSHEANPSAPRPSHAPLRTAAASKSCASCFPSPLSRRAKLVPLRHLVGPNFRVTGRATRDAAGSVSNFRRHRRRCRCPRIAPLGV